MPVVKIIRLTRFAPRKAQSVERQPFKLVAVGSSPTSGRGRGNPLGYTQKPQGNGDDDGYFPIIGISNI